MTVKKGRAEVQKHWETVLVAKDQKNDSQALTESGKYLKVTMADIKDQQEQERGECGRGKRDVRLFLEKLGAESRDLSLFTACGWDG
jgi:hypothetical protein